MGFIIDTGDDLVGLERRRESYYVLDLSREWDSATGKNKSSHVFAYGNGEIELSAEFLDRLVDWFEKHPEERAELYARAVSHQNRGG